MVIRGRTRGNGRQLAEYLLTMGENEHIRILDANGRKNPKEQHLRDDLLSMSLTSELTKSDKGLYHAQINPAYGDDKTMTAKRWLEAADLLGKELGLESQRRVIVLHTKKDRTHAHIVWERYDLDKQRMVSDSFSRLSQDRARKEMEILFEHKMTPRRNEKRPELKETLGKLWQASKTGQEFIKEAAKEGYLIAKGVQRRPFMVVDNTGRSFDLVRQLDGIKTKDVREKLGQEKLPPEKEALTKAKAAHSEKQMDKTQEEALDSIATVQTQRELKAEQRKAKVVHEFADNRPDINQPDKEFRDKQRQQQSTAQFVNEADDLTTKPLSDKQKAANSFAENRADIIEEKTDKQMEKERKRQAVLNRLKEQRQRLDKNKGRGYDD